MDEMGIIVGGEGRLMKDMAGVVEMNDLVSTCK
jgi:hypothetical protein